MNSKSKNNFTKNIMNVFISNDFLILVNFKSINASDSLDLRNSLKSIGGGMLVVKNTLARLALKNADRFLCLSDKFSGSIAVIYSNDIVKSSKLIVNFIDANQKKMSIVCAAHLDQLLTVEDINKLAKLPSLDELRFKIIRLISYNIHSRLTSSINSPSMRLIKVLDFYSSKK